MRVNKAVKRIYLNYFELLDREFDEK